MAQQVVGGAVLKCSFGAAPSPLTVLPVNATRCGNMFAATVMDHVPMANIMPFGACSAPANPGVIAALGSPVPCVPVTPAPWIPGSPTVMIANQVTLNSTSKCLCTWLGIITVQQAGQMPTEVP